MAPPALSVRLRYRPLDAYEGSGDREAYGDCQLCLGGGVERIEEWAPETPCRLCLGDGRWRMVGVPERGGGPLRLFMTIYLSRWLWELVTGRREPEVEGDGPWTVDGDAWRGGGGE